MRRENSPVRQDFAEHAAEIGFTFATVDGEPYWDESARYVFSLGEIEDDLEAATSELHALCLELVDRVAQSEELMRRLRIPHQAFDIIAESWARRDPSLYGRFDFAYDGEGPPKLLEYNADTPTSLVESSVVQWHWLEQLAASGALPEHVDQFNSLHERLVARFGEIGGGTLRLACMSDSPEDLTTVSYLEECARGAGLVASLVDMRDIGLSADEAEFIDRRGARIDRLFKLYAWEWMFADPFGRAPAMRRTRFIEPPWKMILSNKGMLALLWQMAPNHPNLLRCFFEEDARSGSLRDYARKPIYSREGANIELMQDGARRVGEKDGYGREGFVRQELRLLPQFDGRYPVLGCWVVGDQPAGLGVREDVSPITSTRARFAPHVIL